MKSVRNAIKALELLVERDTEVGVTEVSARLGIPKSSASRLLASMTAGGLLQQEPGTRRYRPGILAFRLGSLFRSIASVHDLAREIGRGLTDETGHSTWVGILDANDVVILYNHNGNWPARFAVPLGSRLPAHATSLGKAILSRMSDEEVRHFYARRKLRSRTERTIVDVDTLLEDLHRARARGFSISDEETFPGVRSVGVPIADGTGHVVGLAVSLPVAELAEGEEQSVTRKLLAAAHSVDWG